ncbi:MAG: hypothetical protein M3Q07_22255 [Pseudobdellovibrionaceae bacterium]|nr:hypothetical protein [Pseudobdellovibrionaceae bacterium]
MLTFEQIADEAKAYSNLTSDQLQEMGTDTLHEQLSLRLVAQEEVTGTKKSFVGSSNDLLKRIKGDVLCINQEIRRRHAAAKDEGSQKRETVMILEALPEPMDLEVIL